MQNLFSVFFTYIMIVETPLKTFSKDVNKVLKMKQI